MSGGGGADRHETLVLRLDVGHEHVLLAKPQMNDPSATAAPVHTHRWTLFVRGHNEAPLDSSLIQKVVFQLHQTIPNPKRVISSPPYEVTETGYGGFVIPIFIYFAHSKEEKYFEYDMILTYDQCDKKRETKFVEFKDPKPELRTRLLKAGAEVRSSKAQPNAIGFRDLFGETLVTPSPSVSNDKTKVPSAFASAHRPSTSPSTTNGSSIKKSIIAGKPTKTATSATASSISQPRSPYEISKKRRSSKDSIASSGNRYDVEKANGAAQYLLHASKLPPVMSPIRDGICDPAFPSTSTASKYERRNGGVLVENSEDSKTKKSSSKISRNAEQSSTGISSTSRGVKRMQNGASSDQKATKRKKTKSDSGLDSDYSSGVNAHSPGLVNGQHSNCVNDHGGASSLFSPPDSVRSLDTLQESPASAASTSSGASSISRNGKRNGCDDEHSAPPAASSAHANSDKNRLGTLILLQQRIMTIKERRLAQEVADLISRQGSYEVTSDCLEFDLCNLSGELIQRLLRLLDLHV